MQLPETAFGLALYVGHWTPEAEKLWVMAMALILPFIFWGMGLQTLISDIRWRKRAKSSVGRPVAWEEIMLGKTNPKLAFRLVVEFMAEDGKTYRFSASKILTKKPEKLPTQNLPVSYLPENPVQARLDTAGERPRPWLILSLAVVFTIGAIWFCRDFFDLGAISFILTIFFWVLVAGSFSPNIAKNSAQR